MSRLYIVSLLNLHVEYIMWNAELDESQAGIKISRTIINNLRYADDPILMAESEEKLKSLLIRVKEKSEKAGLKLNTLKTKIMAYSPKKWKQWQILFSWAPKITVNSDFSYKIKRCLLLGRKAMTNLDSILNSRNITLHTKSMQRSI